MSAIGHGGRPQDQQCRECGCTEFDPCIDGAGQPCAWAESDLCTFCAEKLESSFHAIGLQIAQQSLAARNAQAREHAAKFRKVYP